MLLIRALLLWTIISVHVVGGAAVFRRLFPRESLWFGFIVPSLAFVILMNFIEHVVAIPSLLWLLPFTTVGFIWSMFNPKLDWKGLRLPTGIFLGSFVFTLALRAITSSIPDMRDGNPDLALVSSYLMGDKLPPPFAWDPDLPLSRYYALLHYAASVLTRLLGVDIGTGFNLSSALLSAFDCFVGAAAAWCISRKTIWITVIAPVLMEGASTGATAYLYFIESHLNPNHADNLFLGFDNPLDYNPILKLIQNVCRQELAPPGAWSWIGSLHSTCGGLFLVLFFVWSLAEVLQRKAADWPWICLGAVPLLTIVTCTWAFPFEALLFSGTLFWAWYLQLCPRNLRFVLLGLGLTVALMLPVLTEFLTTASISGFEWTGPECRIQRYEYIILWWPIYFPVLGLLFVWSELPPAIKTVIISLPIALVVVDLITVANREDWVGKVWCFIYGAGWVVLVPAVLMRRAILFRLLAIILVASSLCSLWAWSSFVWRVYCWDCGDALHLEGTGPFRRDPALSTLLEDISRLRGKTILTGKADPSGSPPLAAFSGNRIYVACWSEVGAIKAGSPAPDIAKQRGQEVNDFYEGKCENPLLFLRTRDISAAVVFPEDKIDTKTLEILKKQLAPYYEYTDCHGDNVNAGIFFFHPEILKWPAAAILHPPLPN